MLNDRFETSTVARMDKCQALRAAAAAATCDLELGMLEGGALPNCNNPCLRLRLPMASPRDLGTANFARGVSRTAPCGPRLHTFRHIDGEHARRQGTKAVVQML